MPKSQIEPRTAGIIEAMECLPVSKIPEGTDWRYEIKLDGYRLQAVRSAGETTLFSRRKNVLNKKFHYVAKALEGLPNGTVLDGELAARRLPKRGLQPNENKTTQESKSTVPEGMEFETGRA
jgi:ATP-dependent DNA ligase